MSPFKSYKQIKLAVDKLLNSEVGVKLSDVLFLLLYLVFQLIVLVTLLITLFKSGAL
ncbi:hypothetical protein AN214_03153 [Pseudoalteromonas sp. P1-9]|nr:hypothetical protein AN214_03153 [Pseudoalteromonas sp. P1-9]